MASKKLLAFHEAGHAVSARRLGLTISYVSLFPTQGSAADAQHHSASYAALDADQATRLDAFERDLMVCLAGPYAQIGYRPSTQAQNREAWEQDINNAGVFAGSAAMVKAGRIRAKGDTTPLSEDLIPEATRFYEAASLKAKDLVKENWPAIIRVAEALLVRLVLNQADVDDLIAGRPDARQSVIARAFSTDPIPPPRSDPPG